MGKQKASFGTVPKKRKPASTDTQSVKRSRPDRAAARCLRATLEDYAVKVSFGGRLVKACPPHIKTYIQSRIDAYVLSVSQLLRRGSLILDEVLHNCIDQGEVPQLSSTFVRQCIVADLSNDRVRHVVTTSFASHPPVERFEGDWGIINYAANQYFTNFHNTIYMNFEKRLTAFVTAWLDTHYPYESIVSWIVASILGRQPNRAMVLPQRVFDFVSTVRNGLGNPTDLNVSETSFEDLVLLTARVQRLRFEMGLLGGGFTLAPQTAVKRHHIVICTTVLYGILNATFKEFGEGTPEWIQEAVLLGAKDMLSEEHADGYPYRDFAWMHFFDTMGLTWNDFAQRIVTDGVSTSVMYRRQKREPKVADPSVAQTAERVITIDPGRVRLVTSHERVGNDVVYSLLSGKHVRQAYKGSIDRIRKWDLRLRDVDERLGEWSLRSASEIMREEYRRVYFEEYHRLWHERGHKRRSRERFHIMSQKRSVLDSFFQGFIQKDRPNPVVLYGASKFASHGPRGEVAVPVKRVLQACRRYFTTILVDEYMTTKRHSVCHAKMHPVRTRRGGEEETRRQANKRTVRGLYFCRECGLFVDRDRDACKSIREAGLSDTRPAYLCRGQEFEYKRPLDLLPEHLVAPTYIG